MAYLHGEITLTYQYQTSSGVLNQTQYGKVLINSLLEKGKGRETIYEEVMQEMKIPRSTVRRIAREVRIELAAKLNLLEGGTN